MEEFANYGILGIIVFFCLVMANKYFNQRLAQMQRQFEHQLKDRQYEVSGTIKVEGDQSYSVELDFKIVNDVLEEESGK